MLGEQRLDAIDYSAPIHFERIRNVVVGNAKQQLDEFVPQPLPAASMLTYLAYGIRRVQKFR
jgi:hypothetical protein